MPGYSKHCDLTGTKVARWEVLRKGPERHRGAEFMYWCRCDCGTEKYVRPASLHTGDSKSCGCLREEIIGGSEYVGKRFGQLVVLERVTREQTSCGTRWLYRCKCDCGKEIVLTAARLGSRRRGQYLSCGCMRGVRLARGQGGLNLLYHEYRTGAQARGLTFELSKEAFREITQRQCFYCAAPPTKQRNHMYAKTSYSTYTYNGIDRVKNTEGYTTSNCVPCCEQCNFAKGRLQQGAFLALARAIAARHPEAVATEP